MSRSSTSAPAYRALFKLVLERLDAETVHRLTGTAMRVATHPRFARSLLNRLLAPRDPRLRVRALGLEFASPVGVAAGLDKEGTWFEGLGALGFGFVEVGTVTARPQPGNPRPRVSRHSGERALVNSMGFPNSGAAVVGARLRRRRRQTIVGVNIGKTRVVAPEDAGADYASCARQVADCADYLVVNVSSPNTPGLRDMQAEDQLEGLIGAVRSALPADGPHPPLLIKIAPDLGDEQIDAIADLALKLRVDGIVAVNTTIDPTVLSDGAHEAVIGGISGRPLKARALEVLARLRGRVGGRLVLISVGGIETPGEAFERIAAGATLVQVYTAFVYGGPLWPRRMNRGLSELVREGGWSRVQDAIGTAAAATTPSATGTSGAARIPRIAAGEPRRCAGRGAGG